MAKAKHDPEDYVQATCELCDVSVKEDLGGLVIGSREASEALNRVSAWMQAHAEQFHPEVARGD